MDQRSKLILALQNLLFYTNTTVPKTNRTDNLSPEQIKIKESYNVLLNFINNACEHKDLYIEDENATLYYKSGSYEKGWIYNAPKEDLDFLDE
jgi:hypothetical protein